MKVLGALFMGMLGMEVYNLIKNMTPSYCGMDETLCLKPLFGVNERMDLYMFTGKDLDKTQCKKLECVYDRLVQVTNVTNVEINKDQQAWMMDVNMGKDVDDLWGYFVLVRHGESPNPNKHKLVDNKYIDLLYTRAKLTHYLKPSQKNYTNLVADASDEEVQQGSVQLSVLDIRVNVHLGGLLGWAGFAFLTTGFMEPSIMLALARGTIGGGAGFLLRLKQQQQEEERARKLLLFQQASRKPVCHLRQHVNLKMLVDENEYSARHKAPILYHKMHKDIRRPPKLVRYSVVDLGQQNLRYQPKFYTDEEYKRHPYYIDASKASDKIRISWNPVSRVHYSFTQTMEEVFQVYTKFGISQDDLDEIRAHLFRRPLHVIITMQIVGMIQVFLSTMAFKNDVAFFKGINDYTGLSSRSLVTDVLHSVVIFLYVLDYEHASRIILMQLFIEVVIGLWKVKRRLKLHLFFRYGLPWVGAASESGQPQALSRGEAATEAIDARAMRYLKIVLYPLSAAWGVYCLYNYRYSSWWSWFISSLADFAYTFGFINMMPQIFVNYKMKSVAHMPWRVLVYKAFNTFIDDFFAFFLMADYMSDKHRWMTLRDDFVFFIFLYQLWCYPIDKTRQDEYGFVYSSESKDVAETKKNQ